MVVAVVESQLPMYDERACGSTHSHLRPSGIAIQYAGSELPAAYTHPGLQKGCGMVAAYFALVWSRLLPASFPVAHPGRTTDIADITFRRSRHVA